MSRELCNNCGIRPKSSNGKGRKKAKCKTCTKYPKIGDKAKITQCYFCHHHFHPIQLDIDHINGIHTDNRYENFRIVCSNCHRLKNLYLEEYRNHNDRRMNYETIS